MNPAQEQYVNIRYLCRNWKSVVLFWENHYQCERICGTLSYKWCKLSCSAM